LRKEGAWYSNARYGHSTTVTGAGTSPRLLKVTTLGDELRVETRGRSKVFATSNKDRGAILPGGKLSTAYFYSTTTGKFITSDYYQKDYPDWVKRFHPGARRGRTTRRSR
jgi:hypothetical protein